ncbi:RNA 2'-phosphotransferase [Segetibacter sp. 3557_3]|uniref:RNA 2'-phosphotransferase n=1 Tax=Segetibacter sp. 3557_3 TaxID=2547429 RepID=UPI001058D82E|nr:RNA 2'-phosphotransferase [Segetibacter sp. 3557_3]TDH18339.1 RNA 2'-phosphotransferase [Segetibacter sp. 3557_3]
MSKNVVQLSKLLSLVLRHQPGYIGIQLDENGWTPVHELIAAINTIGTPINLATLENVVHTNNKQRFAFNEDQTLIRASQGHSVNVSLNLEPEVPTAELYHGTAQQFVASILQNGLMKRSRNHVHLSADTNTAVQVGSRRGKPVVLIIDSAAMHANGYTFFLSENGVWLTDHVPREYVRLA